MTHYGNLFAGIFYFVSLETQDNVQFMSFSLCNMGRLGGNQKSHTLNGVTSDDVNVDLECSREKPGGRGSAIKHIILMGVIGLLYLLAGGVGGFFIGKKCKFDIHAH